MLSHRFLRPEVWGRCKDAFGQTWGLCEPQNGPPPSNEDMAVAVRLGEKHKWKWSWTEEDVPKMYCFGEVRCQYSLLI